MDLTTISTIIGSTASLLSAILMYYFTQHFPWETSRKNVVRILLEQSPNFKDIVNNLKKNAQSKLGSRHLQREVFWGIPIGILLGLLIPIVLTIGYVGMYYDKLSPLTFNTLAIILLLWASVTWFLMLLATYVVFAFKDSFLYPVSRIYLGSSLVFIASFGIATLNSNSAEQFLAVYLIVFGTIILLGWGLSKKEDKLVREEWFKLSNERKSITLRVYTQDGREFIGILQNVFDDTWLQLKRVDSRSTINIEWRTIKGVEVISDDS
ncbi:hypothetical protein CDI07_00895 [Thermococcus sp. 5-4]|nr:hypothetical protein CDI07_00895 [Thermococcus sp. 5-4]